jgi:hypothetical protein
MTSRRAYIALNVAVLIITTAALALAVASGLRSQSYARCQAGVNDALIAAQSARADAAQQDRAADRAESAATADLIRTVFEASTTAERRAAYAKYRKLVDEVAASRAEAELERSRHPIPAPPSVVCT